MNTGIQATDVIEWPLLLVTSTACVFILVKKDIEIQPGFKPGSSEFQSDAVTNWATATLAMEQGIDGIYL